MSDSQQPNPAPEEEPRDDDSTGAADEAVIPSELSVLPLKDTVVYPGMSVPLVVGRPASRRLVNAVTLEERILGLVMQMDASQEEPAPEQLHEVGTAAQIVKLLKFPDGNLRLIVRGLERIRVQRYTATTPYLKARTEVLHDAIRPGIEIDALAKNVQNLLQKMFGLMPIVPEEVSAMLLSVDDPGRLADAVAAVLLKDAARKQEILQTLDVRHRLETITRLLAQEIEVVELGTKIQQEVQDEMGKSQKDYILRQQLKAIQKELGEEDEAASLAREFEEKIAAAGMPEEAEAEARRELERLKVMPAAAAEHTVARTYLEWMVDLPWSRSTDDKLDISDARRILDEDHYDLDKIKDRILEYLAVRKLKDDMKGPILCLAGPPGTGKTSLGRSIARAMGREFHRMSLGGVRDEAEIRGHRRTYVGALPGRIIQALRKVKTNNPVIILDEIDKLGSDFRGDPSSALLEVLDPQQNDNFNDHYLGVSFDLSRVLFIATANLLETVPGPLRDRMEVLRLAGYTMNDKLQIARRYLVPRQLKNHGLTADQLSIHKDALEEVITGYTREAGVRNLERSIGSIARKVARRIVEESEARQQETAAEAADGQADQESRVVVGAAQVADYLGPVQFESELAERTAVPGVATGLAWTSTGGEILFIESTRMPGAKTLTLTGQLGDVMKESAQTALSLVRSRSAALKLKPGFFADADIHLHVPAGATPKDGPSAGVAMATSLASLLTGREVRSEVAMTGEITLRGRVLPVGGVKEKVLAAHRAGIRCVILPERNRKDLGDVPDDVRTRLEFVFASEIEDVWDAALQPVAGKESGPRKSRGSKGRPKPSTSPAAVQRPR